MWIWPMTFFIIIVITTIIIIIIILLIRKKIYNQFLIILELFILSE